MIKATITWFAFTAIMPGKLCVDWWSNLHPNFSLMWKYTFKKSKK